jgi:hypothetical protein
MRSSAGLAKCQLCSSCFFTLKLSSCPSAPTKGTHMELFLAHGGHRWKQTWAYDPKAAYLCKIHQYKGVTPIVSMGVSHTN